MCVNKWVTALSCTVLEYSVRVCTLFLAGFDGLIPITVRSSLSPSLFSSSSYIACLGVCDAPQNRGEMPAIRDEVYLHLVLAIDDLSPSKYT
jgi:hypothetical protein